MRKYGKKNVVKLDPSRYNIGLIGESGIGKSTIVKEICEKMVGVEGYIAFDIGKEDGHGAIQGIVTQAVPTWEVFSDVIDDIIENKEEDYKDLKMVIIDTYDQLLVLAEKEVIRLHNKTNPESKVTSIKAAFGGFQAGEDKALELTLDKLWELKEVGVQFFVIGHTKRKEIEDSVSGQVYTMLTTNMPQKYFTGIKTKLHFLAVASIDREVVKRKSDKKGLKGKDIMIGKAVSEIRTINFRDDNYSIDSKSRFATIENKIEFDPDEFIRVIQEAINTEYEKDGKITAKAIKDQTNESEKVATEALKKKKREIEESNSEEEKEALLGVISNKFGTLDSTKKETLKEMLAKSGCGKFSDEEMPLSTLQEMIALIETKPE